MFIVRDNTGDPMPQVWEEFESYRAATEFAALAARVYPAKQFDIYDDKEVQLKLVASFVRKEDSVEHVELQ